MILADNIYLQKNSELGKKHSRPKDSNEEDNFYENKKKLRIKKDNEEELKIEKVDEVDEDKNNKLNEDNNIKNTIELKKEQNIEIQIIKQKKEKKLKMESNERIKYSDDSFLIAEQLLKNKMNKIDNTNKFTIKRIYDNKLEIKEDIKKRELEEKFLSSYVVLPKDENYKIEEERKNNSDDTPKKIKENTFNLFSYDNIENKEKNISKLQNKNIIDKKEKENIKNIINQEDLYSYECLTENLYIKGIRGIDQLFIDINIKNNGKLNWPNENIFLRNDKEKSTIIADEIKIIPLMSGWVSKERIVFKYLNNLIPNIYYSYINLNINGKNYGKPIKIKVEIIENEEEKKINNLINKIRNDYQLPINQINDEQLKKALIKNNFDTTKTFESLFNGE